MHARCTRTVINLGNFEAVSFESINVVDYAENGELSAATGGRTLRPGREPYHQEVAAYDGRGGPYDHDLENCAFVPLHAEVGLCLHLCWRR